MNIRPQSERTHKLRFLDPVKARQVQRQDDERRERQGKRVVKLHESFTDNKLPSTENIREAVIDYFQEFGKRPTELVIIGSSKTSSVSLHVPDIFPPDEFPVISLRIVQGEFEEVR